VLKEQKKDLCMPFSLGREINRFLKHSSYYVKIVVLSYNAPEVLMTKTVGHNHLFVMKQQKNSIHL
jgi:hypothetical protein